MADQAPLRENGPGLATGRMGTATETTGRPSGDRNGNGDFVGNIAEFADDLLSLGELQSRLAAIELRQNVRAATVGGSIIAVGAVLAVAAVPVALAGIAEVLVSWLGMNRGLALIAVAVATLMVAGACIAAALGRLRASDMGFPLTREEFTRNLNWIRTVILYSGRSPRRWR